MPISKIDLTFTPCRIPTKNHRKKTELTQNKPLCCRETNLIRLENRLRNDPYIVHDTFGQRWCSVRRESDLIRRGYGPDTEGIRWEWLATQDHTPVFSEADVRFPQTCSQNHAAGAVGDHLLHQLCGLLLQLVEELCCTVAVGFDVTQLFLPLSGQLGTLQ